MYIRILLYTLIIGTLVACGASKNVNFLGVQEEQKKTAVPPPNSSFEQNTAAAASLAKTDKKESDKTPKYLKNYVEEENYAAAINDLEAELEINPQAGDINFYTAESYRKIGQPKEALPYYDKAIAAGFDHPELEINYAFSLKANEQYEEAKQVLEDYVTYASVEVLKERAQLEIAHLSKLDSISLFVRDVDVQLLNGINTTNAEYSPSYYDGDLYYVSLSEPGQFERFGIPYSDIYKAKLNGLKVDETAVGSLPGFFNELNINEGSIAFSPDGTLAVFAKGNSDDKRGRRSVDLFLSKKKNGNWSRPESMPINSPSYWDTSPVFNNSGNTIYFASDRPGGYGGSDIYRASLNARGRWSDVTNMGPDINTAGDEVFPYVSPDNKLYFASDGHAGFGLLDLFEAVNKSGTVTVRNLGPSFNTSSDDFGLIYTDFPFEGFFSSNRDGGLGSDDIYSFVDNSSDLKKIQYVLKGTTYQRGEDSTQAILGNVEVKLMDENGVMVDDIISSRAGSFSFPVQPEKSYTLIGDKENFFTGRIIFSTLGERVPQEELVERFTEKVFDSEVVLDPIILNKSILVPNIYYDLNQANIRADAALELDKLVILLADNPNIRIELSSHTDSRAGDDFNQDLSQRRAQSAVDYIVSQGIPRSRLVAKGYGETQLINGCANDVACSEAEHQQNRRTEFKVIDIEK
jgi:outer membrane protein OmpA-like peptidoglycan-associated protein